MDGEEFVFGKYRESTRTVNQDVKETRNHYLTRKWQEIIKEAPRTEQDIEWAKAQVKKEEENSKRLAKQGCLCDTSSSRPVTKGGDNGMMRPVGARPTHVVSAGGSSRDKGDETFSDHNLQNPLGGSEAREDLVR